MPGPATRILRTLLTSVVFVTVTAAAPAAQTAGQAFRWAGDPEGGAPYVEASPDNPDQLVGFDVEIADLLARGLGRTPQFVFVTFTSIIQSIGRGDAEIGLSGIEDAPVLRSTMAVTNAPPYYPHRAPALPRSASCSRSPPAPSRPPG